MKKKNVFVGATFVFVFLVGALVYFFLFTTPGSIFLVKSIISKYAQSGHPDIAGGVGSLSRSLVLQDMEIDDSKLLPSGSILKVQKLELYFTSLNLEGLQVKVDNGRLQLSRSGLVLFYGTLQNNLLDFNLYAQNVHLSEVPGLKKMSGTVDKIDFYVKGRLLQPRFNGTCQIARLERDSFSLSDCPLSFNVQLKAFKKEPELQGSVFTESGEISGPKTAIIQMKESKISFSGVFKKAALNLKGISEVDGTKISAELKGTLDEPELKLVSDPPLPQERLMVMLMTNKGWKGAEDIFSKGGLSPDLARDFIDYFVFSGSGSKVAQRFGITGFSITLDEQKKGLGIKKEITEKIDATYAIEQSQEKEEPPATTQRIGAELKITESISVGAEKELRQEAETDTAQQQPNDKVILKIRKEF
ncbi:MAG: translocation/assembly module TamB domain-containing protein [Candidatus Omnitrophota bacterium]